MRNIVDSWPFALGFFAVMVWWAAGNISMLERVVHPRAFDPYPYILLDLFLSVLAGIQAPALPLAVERADSFASRIAIHTEKNTDNIKVPLSENTELTKEVRRDTDFLEEIHRPPNALNSNPGEF